LPFTPAWFEKVVKQVFQQVNAEPDFMSLIPELVLHNPIVFRACELIPHVLLASYDRLNIN